MNYAGNHVARISYDLHVNDDGRHYLYLTWHNAVSMCGLASRIIRDSRDIFNIVGITLNECAVTYKFYCRGVYWDDPQQLISDWFDYVGCPYVYDTSYMPDCPEWEY